MFMDFVSFEVVCNFCFWLMGLLEFGKVDLVFVNEDEVGEFIKGEENLCFEICLNFFFKYCERVVVMLGFKGCIVCYGDEIVCVLVIREIIMVDIIGVGDLFVSGFLYGVLNGFLFEDCCKMGCCIGGVVVCGFGGEVGEEGWEWM